MIELKRGTALIIREAEAILQTQTSFDGAEIPPTPPTAIGAGEIQPEPEITDAQLFWAIHNEVERELFDPTADKWLLRDLDRCMEKYELPKIEPPKRPSFRERVGEFYHALKKDRPVDRFIAKAKEIGLIRQPEPLSIREYIGAIVP